MIITSGITWKAQGKMEKEQGQESATALTALFTFSFLFFTWFFSGCWIISAPGFGRFYHTSFNKTSPGVI